MAVRLAKETNGHVEGSPPQLRRYFIYSLILLLCYSIATSQFKIQTKIGLIFLGLHLCKFILTLN